MTGPLNAPAQHWETTMDDLVKALRSGEQADMDGTLVKVSRQACEEAADAIESLQAQLAEARDKARSVADAYDRANPMRTADIHRDGCDCLRCAVDAIRAMKGERG